MIESRPLVVGIFEHFADSARMCLNLLGVECREVPFFNAATRESAVDKETYDAIRERHSVDYELYSYGIAEFWRQEAA